MKNKKRGLVDNSIPTWIKTAIPLAVLAMILIIILPISGPDKANANKKEAQPEYAFYKYGQI